MACMGRCSQEDARRDRSRRRLRVVLSGLRLDAAGAAERFGCSASKIYGVLSGRDRLTLDMALVLQEQCGVPAKWLLALDEVRPQRRWEAVHDGD